MGKKKKRKDADDGLFYRIIRLIGQIAAIVAVALWIVTLLNRRLAGFGVADGALFLGGMTGTVEFIRDVVSMVAVVFCGLSLAVKRVLFLILYCLVVAVLFILLFFPGLLGIMVGASG